jgi:uncharacterized membrane protein YkvA (DUF1232 family)
VNAFRDYLNLLPATATMVRRLRADDRVPRRAKIVLAVALASVVSPIDLIPDFIPVIGALDDVAVVLMALRYVRRQIPREAFEDAWPGDPKMLSRILRWAT